MGSVLNETPNHAPRDSKLSKEEQDRLRLPVNFTPVKNINNLGQKKRRKKGIVEFIRKITILRLL